MGGNWWQWEDTTKPKAYEWEYEKAEKEAQQRKSWLDLLPGFGGEEPTLQAGAPHPILAGMEWWGEQQRNLAAASMEQQRIEQGLQRGEVLEPKSWAEALRQYAETPEPGMPPFGRLAATELGMHLAAAEQGEPYQMPPVSTMPREAFPVKGFTEMLADPLWATTFLPWGGLEALPAVARGLGAAGRRVAPAVSQAARRAAPVAREMAESEVTGFARMMGQKAARGQAEFARLPKATPAQKVAADEIKRLAGEIGKIDRLLTRKGRVPGSTLTRAQFEEGRGGMKADLFLAETMSDPSVTTAAQVAADVEGEMAKAGNELDARAAPYHGAARNAFPQMTSPELDAYAFTLQKHLGELRARPAPVEQAPRTAMQAGMGIGERAPQGQLLPEYGAGTTAYKGQLPGAEVMQAKAAREAGIARGQLEMAAPEPAAVVAARPTLRQGVQGRTVIDEANKPVFIKAKDDIGLVLRWDGGQPVVRFAGDPNYEYRVSGGWRPAISEDFKALNRKGGAIQKRQTLGNYEAEFEKRLSAQVLKDYDLAAKAGPVVPPGAESAAVKGAIEPAVPVGQAGAPQVAPQTPPRVEPAPPRVEAPPPAAGVPVTPEAVKPLATQPDAPAPLAGSYVAPEKPFWEMAAEELAQIQPMEPPVGPPVRPAAKGRYVPPEPVEYLRLPPISSIDEVVGRAFVQAERPRIAQIAAGKKVLEWAGRVLNPSAFADAAPEQLVIALGRIQAEAGGLATGVLSQMAVRLARKYPKGAPRGNPFTGMKNAMVKVNKQGQEVEAAIGDVAEHFEQYGLNPAQREFCEIWAGLAQQQTGQSLKAGVDFKVLHITGPGERWPRFVVGKNGEPLATKVGPKTTIGAKQKFRNSRFYEEMADGVKAGINYEGNPYAVMHADLASHYIAQAHAQAARWLEKQGFGQLPKARLLAWFPGVVREAGDAARSYTTASHLEGLVQRARRGERLHPSTLAAVDRYMPEFGQKLRSTDKTSLKELVAEARTIKGDAATRLARARFEYQKAKNIASAPRLGEEGTVVMPAFRGRIFDKETADYLNKAMGDRAGATSRFIQQAISVPRFAVTGFDVGVGTIHLLPLLGSNPRAWVRSQIGMFKIAANPMYRAEQRAAHAAAFEGLTRAGVTSASDYTEAAIKGGLLERAPVVGKVAGAAADMFEGAIELAQLYMWEAMAPSLKRMGAANWEEQLGAHIAAWTGTGAAKKLGINTRQTVAESVMLFAPRYTRAFGVILMDLSRGGLRGHLARENMARFVAAGLASYVAACLALRQEPKLDPRDPHCFTVEILGQRVGPGSVWVAAAKTLGKITAAVEKDPHAFAAPDPGRNPLLRFWYSRASQPASQTIDLLRGRNYLGEPLTMDDPMTLTRDIVAGNALPFWLQDVVGSRFGEATNVGGLSIGMAAQIGGARAYPISPAGQRDKRQDEAAYQSYGLAWDEVGSHYGRLAQLELIEGDKKLRDATEAAHRQFIERAGGDYTDYAEWSKERERARQTYYLEPLQKAQQGLLAGKTGSWFREQSGTIKDRYQAVLQDIDARHPAVKPLFDKWAGERATSEVLPFVGDVAYEEYWAMAEMVGEDQFGEYDYEARKDAENTFRQKWGSRIWDYVQSRIRWGRKDEPQAMQELRQARELLEPYWEIADEVWAKYPGALAQAGYLEWLEGTDKARAGLLRRRATGVKMAQQEISLKRAAVRRAYPMIDKMLSMYYR